MQPSALIVDKLIDEALISAIDEKFVDAASITDKEAYENNKFPVDIIEFAESTEFLNLKGQLYKQVINLLIDIEDNTVREADLILGKGCIEKSTPILTKSGFKRILEVDSDLIDGSYSKKFLWTTDSGIEIRVEGIPPIKYTNDHPILVFKVLKGEEGPSDRGTWKRADEVVAGDWVMTDLSFTPALPKDKDVLDPNLIAIIARYLSDGYLNKDSVSPRSICLTFGNRSKKDSERFLVYAKNLGFTKAHLEFKPNLKGENAWQLRLHSTELAKWFLNNFGEHSMEKNIPSWFLSLPEDLIKLFLEEYSDGSSYIYKKKYQVDSWSSGNLNMFMMLTYLNLKLGRTGQYVRQKVSKDAYAGSKYPIHRLIVVRNRKFSSRTKFYGEAAYIRVSSVKKISTPFDVVNITTETHLIHTPYITHNSGKSLLAQVYSLFGCYGVLQLKNPQAVFKLTQNTPLYSVNVSVSARQAKDNVFAGIKYLVERSEYFKGIANIRSEEIDLPKGVRLLCGHSNFTSFLGYPIFRAVMDEVNFMTDNNNRSVSKQLYSALRGSLKTRFPGSYKLLSISSDSLPNSFLRERVQSLKELIRESNG